MNPGAAVATLSPGSVPGRLVRASARIAGVGATFLATATRLRAIREEPAATRARGQALALQRSARDVLALHGIHAAAGGATVPRGALLASNHVSWLDPLVVAAHVPCLPVSKADVAAWPLVGTLARELGVVFVSRGDAGSGASALRAIRAALDAGACVLNFPEGTTSQGDGVLPFRPGLFGLALRAGAPVVPVAIRYEPRSLAWTGDASFVPHYLALASSHGARVSVRLGAPVTVRPGASAQAVADEVRARVEALLAEA